MKKSTLLILSLIIVSFYASNTFAENDTYEQNTNYKTKIEEVTSSLDTKETYSEEPDVDLKNEERAKLLNNRLVEIRDIDKSELTALERRELRSEVKEIKKELAELSGGVYLSVGAIVVILLLLILLL